VILQAQQSARLIGGGICREAAYRRQSAALLWHSVPELSADYRVTLAACAIHPFQLLTR
jgi:hypothetical protein